VGTGFSLYGRAQFDSSLANKSLYLQNDVFRVWRLHFHRDALVNIATALGCRVRFDLEAA
jgi:hypothetical protein